MHTELFQARENLKHKLLENATVVINEVLNFDLPELIEIGIFGSIAKDKFTCKSDSDIYLLFKKNIPDRQIKGILRSKAEENNCDIVFLTENDFKESNRSFLAKNILESSEIVWRREE